MQPPLRSAVFPGLIAALSLCACSFAVATDDPSDGADAWTDVAEAATDEDASDASLHPPARVASTALEAPRAATPPAPQDPRDWYEASIDLAYGGEAASDGSAATDASLGATAATDTTADADTAIATDALTVTAIPADNHTDPLRAATDSPDPTAPLDAPAHSPPISLPDHVYFAASDDPYSATATRAFARVYGADSPRVVLRARLERGVAAAWGTGPARIVATRGRRVQVARGVRIAAVPAELAAFEGRTVHLLNAHGVVCDATLSGIELVSEIEFQDARPTAAPSALARTLWPLTECFALLTITARPVDASSSCAGATWARAQDLALPTLVAAHAPDAALARRVRAAHRATGDNAETIDQLLSYYPGRVHVVAYGAPAAGPEVAWVGLHTRFDWLVTTSLAAMYEVTRTRAGIVLRAIAASETGPAPEFAADLDGDGDVEWPPPFELRRVVDIPSLSFL